MKTPKENPEDKAARQRERRISMLELNRSSQEQSARATTDIRSVYGMGGLSLFSMMGAPALTGGGTAGPVAKPKPFQPLRLDVK